jgi:hypothetical protein
MRLDDNVIEYSEGSKANVKEGYTEVATSIADPATLP